MCVLFKSARHMINNAGTTHVLFKRHIRSIHITTHIVHMMRRTNMFGSKVQDMMFCSKMQDIWLRVTMYMFACDICLFVQSNMFACDI